MKAVRITRPGGPEVLDACFPVENAREACERMLQNATFGKVVLPWP